MTKKTLLTATSLKIFEPESMVSIKQDDQKVGEGYSVPPKKHKPTETMDMNKVVISLPAPPPAKNTAIPVCFFFRGTSNTRSFQTQNISS